MSLAILALTATAASAATGTFAGGTWNRGNQQGSTGWYMAHSYYNHPTLAHAAESWLNGTSESGYVIKMAGVNACSNSKSQQSRSFDNYANNISGFSVEEIGYGTY